MRGLRPDGFLMRDTEVALAGRHAGIEGCPKPAGETLPRSQIRPQRRSGGLNRRHRALAPPPRGLAEIEALDLELRAEFLAQLRVEFLVHVVAPRIGRRRLADGFVMGPEFGVVGIDGGGAFRRIVALPVDHQVLVHARFLLRRLRRIAEAHAEDAIDVFRQAQNLGDLDRIVAHRPNHHALNTERIGGDISRHADQRGVDRGDQTDLEVVVFEGVAVALQDDLKARQIGAEGKEHRAIDDVLLVAGRHRELLFDLRVAHHDHAVGLNIRRGRRAEGGAQDGIDLRIGHRRIAVFPNAAALQQGLDGLARGAAFVRHRRGFVGHAVASRKAVGFDERHSTPQPLRQPKPAGQAGHTALLHRREGGLALEELSERFHAQSKQDAGHAGPRRHRSPHSRRR